MVVFCVCVVFNKKQIFIILLLNNQLKNVKENLDVLEKILRTTKLFSDPIEKEIENVGKDGTENDVAIPQYSNIYGKFIITSC